MVGSVAKEAKGRAVRRLRGVVSILRSIDVDVLIGRQVDRVCLLLVCMVNG